MDENHRPAYSLKAPGADSGAPVRLPGHGDFPGVDDRLVRPEETRDEIIGGRKVIAFPAELPHAERHSELGLLVRTHAAPGYRAALDLLTRFDRKSDFATDACLLREGIDPETGTRPLEEVAFEVVSEQRERSVTEKARRMHRRGVRRIFALFVKEPPRVAEWQSASDSWLTLDPSARIEDPSFARPLEVAALLDAAAADEAVVEALAAKGSPALGRREAAAAATAKAEGKAEGLAAGKAEGLAAGKAEGLAEGKAEGLAEGTAQALLQFLAARDLAVSPEERRTILSCRDLDRLGKWLVRAASVASTHEVLDEPFQS